MRNRTLRKHWNRVAQDRIRFISRFETDEGTRDLFHTVYTDVKNSRSGDLNRLLSKWEKSQEVYTQTLIKLRKAK
jgi:hypothetical protein